MIGAAVAAAVHTVVRATLPPLSWESCPPSPDSKAPNSVSQLQLSPILQYPATTLG